MNIQTSLSQLIHMLHPNTPLPETDAELWRLYRSLVNTRRPGGTDADFLCLQDAVLQAIQLERGIIHGSELPAAPLDERFSLWRGDITRLAADAIVNAANEQLLGCFIPCHQCIDNAIHTYAGVQLREACHSLMEAQGHEEPVGRAKITPAFNLPSRFVLHTVGPTVHGPLTERECAQLSACYESCLALASTSALSTIAFCCISTGVYRFPKQEAARIALHATRNYLDTHATTIQKVIFNVYEESDDALYRALLGFPA